MALTEKNVVYHLFHPFYMICIGIPYSLLVILNDQAENADDHTKLICCSMYREEKYLT